MKVYGITGLPGSGKSIISRIAKNEGVHIISMGDIVRKEAEKQNCSSGDAAVNLRKKYGNNVIAERCVEEIQNHYRDRINSSNAKLTKMYQTNDQKTSKRKFKKVEQDVYIIEGIRSTYEVSIFRRNFRNFKIIAIHASPETRFNRLKRRNRSDDSTDFRKFLERDRRELRFGIGNVIATADFMLINDGPIPIFKKLVRGLIANEIKPKYKPYKVNNKNKNKPNRKPRKNPNQYKKHNKQNNPNTRNKKDFRNKRRY